MVVLACPGARTAPMAPLILTKSLQLTHKYGAGNVLPIVKDNLGSIYFATQF
jgi:hypothetical protein